MNKTLKTRIFAAAILLAATVTLVKADYSPQAETSLFTTNEMRSDIKKSLKLIASEHYLSRPLDDEMSTAIFDRYFKTLDSSKMYFLASDIKRFEKYRFELDDRIKASNADIGFEIYKLFRTRVEQRQSHIEKLLSKPFNFKKTEYITVDRKEANWENSVEELDELWRKRIKNDYLTQKLGGTDESKIPDNLLKRYNRQKQIVMQTKPDEVFEFFFNSYLSEIEPHTSYMRETTAENFDINLSLKLEGIGASLQTEDDYTVIKKIIKGGPAENSGLVHPEDKIVGVGQSVTTIENVIGWRLMDVVKNIRGKKGTDVHLQIQSESAVPGTPPKLITLTRDVINLEEQSAQLHYEHINDHKYGVIEVSSFYGDPETGKTTSSDVARLLKQSINNNVDGVVIDLRGNGGGYLQEAVNLTGLFIKTGPVVQIKNTKSNPYSYTDNDPRIAYKGPLVVMVDRYSASASEIFSGAIQDYGRGIVIGERTFGKGTVQSLQPLNVSKEKINRKLKLTTHQFFRINGESTQYKGIVPDIILNAGIPDEKFGERAYENALPWSYVKKQHYPRDIYHEALFPHLTKDHNNRIKNNASFKFLQQSSAMIKESQEIKVLPLAENERRSVFKERELARLNLNNQYRKNFDLDKLSLEEIRKPQTDLPNGEDHWKRVFQKEAANILDDIIRLTTPQRVVQKRLG